MILIKHIRLNQLCSNRKALLKLISLINSSIPYSKIQKFVKIHYHKSIWNSSIGLLRKKVNFCNEFNLSIFDLLKHPRLKQKQLKPVTPEFVLDLELSALVRKRKTNTLTQSDQRELVQLLRMSMKSAHLPDYVLK